MQIICETGFYMPRERENSSKKCTCNNNNEKKTLLKKTFYLTSIVTNAANLMCKDLGLFYTKEKKELFFSATFLSVDQQLKGYIIYMQI